MKLKLLIILLAATLISCDMQSQINRGNRISEYQNGDFYTVGKYAYEPSSKKAVKNVVLMIGDGMGLAQIQAGFTANKGQLNLFNCPVTGFVNTKSKGQYVTDSAAAATAFATGMKVDNKVLSVDSNNQPIRTIVEIAAENGLATGLVTTSKITDATPAAFFAHQSSRYFYSDIALDLLSSDISLFIGGGREDFIDRTDRLDLKTIAEKFDFQVANTLMEIEGLKSGKVAGLLAEKNMKRYAEGRGHMLAKSAKKAIELLSTDENGFFLMVESGQIDSGGHKNQIDYLVQEMLDFDRAIGEVLDFAEKDGETLVIITSDHETGGLILLDGDYKSGYVKADFSTVKHTGVMVPIFAFGPGADSFSGVHDNADIFHKVIAEYGF